MYFPRSSLVSTNGWMLERSSKSSRESDTLRRVEGGSQVMRSYRSPSGVKITSLVRWNSPPRRPDRKSTRLNSSHVRISYAVFCLKKKKIPNLRQQEQF